MSASMLGVSKMIESIRMRKSQNFFHPSKRQTTNMTVGFRHLSFKLFIVVVVEGGGVSTNIGHGTTPRFPSWVPLTFA